MKLICLSNLKTLLACIGALAGLTELHLDNCGLADVPSSIECLTALHLLWLTVLETKQQDGSACKTLACALPALRLLQRLTLYAIGKGNVADIGRSLKAWPPPLLDLDALHLLNAQYHSIGLKSCWEVLGLLPKATGWDNMTILDHWLVQQHKVSACASGLHAPLGRSVAGVDAE